MRSDSFNLWLHLLFLPHYLKWQSELDMLLNYILMGLSPAITWIKFMPAHYVMHCSIWNAVIAATESCCQSCFCLPVSAGGPTSQTCIQLVVLVSKSCIQSCDIGHSDRGIILFCFISPLFLSAVIYTKKHSSKWTPPTICNTITGRDRALKSDKTSYKEFTESVKVLSDQSGNYDGMNQPWNLQTYKP